MNKNKVISVLVAFIAMSFSLIAGSVSKSSLIEMFWCCVFLSIGYGVYTLILSGLNEFDKK